MEKISYLEKLKAFELLLNVAQIIVISCDEKGNIIYVSPGTEKIIGYNVEDLLEEKWWKLTYTSTEEEKLFKDKVSDTISGKIEVDIKPYDRMVRCKDGSLKWIEWRDSLGANNTFVSVGVDITSWKQNEELERQSNTILKHIDSMLIVTNKEGEVLYANPSVEKTLGYAVNDIMGDKWWEVTFEDPQEALKMRKELFDNVFFHIEDFTDTSKRKIKTSDGKYKWIEWKVSKGENETFISIGNDITNRILTELELKKAKEFAEETLKVKNKFLTNMSHEIRTPLNSVIGFTDLLLESELTAEQTEQLQTMRSSGEILLSLINDVLDLTKLESEKLEMEEIPFNLPNQLHKIVKLMKVKADEKKIALDLIIDPNTPDLVLGDPTRLVQILLNLIGNAIKFTNEGSVTVSVKSLGETEDSSDIYFEIIDTGIGIVSNKINTVFGAFSQAKSDTSRIYGGTGLGLTIVKKLVNLLKGNIIVKSKFGEGSVFQLTLPLKKGSVKDEKDDKQQNLSLDDPLGLNILLVEDNKVNQLLAKTRLERWECKVDVANNGIEGVKKIQEKLYDLVLMDIQMPIMDGYEATKIIKNDISEQVSKIPIIAMTAYTSKDDIRRALNAGMNDYILKPFSPDNFYKILKKYGDLSKSFEQKENNELNIDSKIESSNQYIDLKFIRQETLNESAILKLLLEQFVKDIDEFLKRVPLGLKEEDWELLYRATHKIKPSISMFGISKMEPIIHVLENKFKNEKKLEGVEELVESIKEIFKHVKSELIIELESLRNE